MTGYVLFKLSSSERKYLFMDKIDIKMTMHIPSESILLHGTNF